MIICTFSKPCIHNVSLKKLINFELIKFLMGLHQIRLSTFSKMCDMIFHIMMPKFNDA